MEETWVWSLGKEDPWGREWQPTPVFLSGEFHAQFMSMNMYTGSVHVHGATKSQTQLSNQHLQFHLLGISKHLNHSTKGSISCPFSKYLLVLWKLWSPTEILSQDDHCLVQRLIPWKTIFINIPEGDHFSSRSSAKFCVFHQLLIFRVNNVTLMLLHIRVYKTITQIFQMFLILLYECVMLGNWKGWKRGQGELLLTCTEWAW